MSNNKMCQIWLHHVLVLFLVQVPVLTETLDVALTKVRWGPNGQLLAVSDVEGVIHIYEVGEVIISVTIQIVLIVCR